MQKVQVFFMIDIFPKNKYGLKLCQHIPQKSKLATLNLLLASHKGLGVFSKILQILGT